MKTEISGNHNATAISLQNACRFNGPFSSQISLFQGSLGTLDGGCIEKLLLHCASALEINDATLAQQMMWVLNNVASSTGDTNQRLTSWFLRALIARANNVCPSLANNNTTDHRRHMTVTEFANYVDLIPWHTFGFCASNSTIYKAIEGCSKVHILDFSITYGMQWPTLIDALSKRPEGPPSVRITVPSLRPPVSPFLYVSSEEVGLRLANFAKLRNVPFEFRVIGDPSHYASSTDNVLFESLLPYLNLSMLNLRDDEALVINCQNWIRYFSNEQKEQNCQDSCLRDAFLRTIMALKPCLVVIVDEDLDLSSQSLASRITTCFNYLWMPFDALDSFLPKKSPQRIEYESDIGLKIDNIVSFEGSRRIERLESGVNLSERMRSYGFFSLPFGEDTVGEVKNLINEHASGWGMKKEDDMLVLTWKGHSSVFATVWVPSGLEG